MRTNKTQDGTFIVDQQSTLAFTTSKHRVLIDIVEIMIKNKMSWEEIHFFTYRFREAFEDIYPNSKYIYMISPEDKMINIASHLLPIMDGKFHIIVFSLNDSIYNVIAGPDWFCGMKYHELFLKNRINNL